jgi:hypothetical protein
MKKPFCRVLALVLSCMMPAMVMGDAGSTALIGMVRNNQNQPVSGVKILAKVSSGQIVSEGTTDGLGRYAVLNLPAGRYQLTLDPTNSPYKGQTVVSAVGTDGLTVNWLVSQTAPALAMATPGTTPGTAPGTTPDQDSSNKGLFGLSPMATGGVIFLGGSAIGFGVAAGVGAFHDGSRGQGNSASQ